jgi:enamine deaminase RidA (YjgF/YER057c/UK114 family)
MSALLCPMFSRRGCSFGIFANLAVMDAVFRAFFGEHKRARTTIPCSGFPEALEVEIDVIAALE